MRSLAIPVLIIVLSSTLISCDKIFKGAISGTWVSEDKLDTITFIENMRFIKNYDGRMIDEFNYSTLRDQIEIQYFGPSNILVRPTTHHFSKFGGRMKIDFSNTMCYGFREQEITFYKQ